ncbi:MAG TPA: transglycosylase SLT domain-containing protein [Gammaproteobacteria bacterium]|nr:transglycosylase SLT domain-containing protein [Gammaproteobacteria bacterium]
MKRQGRGSWLRAASGLAAACWLSSLALAARADADEGDAAVREQFRAAYAAAALGVETADDEALRAYVLYPYLRAARLDRALARAQGQWHEADDAAAEFLAQAGDAPVALPLRRAWLSSLARRESWEAFLAQYETAATTPELECQRLNARIARQDTTGLADDIRARWLSDYRLPSACEAAFQWLRAQGGLPAELVARRVELLLDSGQASFARTIAARLPAEAAAPLLERAQFIESPARMLDAFVRDDRKDVPAPVVLEAWSRLARNAPDEAHARYRDLYGRMKREDARALAQPLAKGMAWDRRAQALDYFERVPNGTLDAVGREWWARAAMWAGKWDEVRAAIAAMRPAEQADWPWLYWAARAAEEKGDKAAARSLYSAALPGDNYYSAMAAARLGERVVPRLEPIPVDAAQVESIAAVDAFRRVRELALLGLRELATNEWHYGYAVLPEAQRLQAIHLAARWEIYDVAVALATSHGRFNDYTLLYPRPHLDEVAAAAKLTDVDVDLLYGVLRQESLFRSDAASSAGALGLAQLTPATARETARRWALPAPNRADLFDPKISITLGAARLKELEQRFGSELPVALGAYNAGEAAAERWLPPRAVDSDVWIENIPYNETRAYVRRVLWHGLVYRWLTTGQPQSTRDWLAKVASASTAP